MAIKHYGLDAAEIENLRAAGLDDDEINAVNETRVKAQVEGVSEDGPSEDDVIKSYTTKMPNAPKIVSTFVFARVGDSADDKTLSDIDTYFKRNKNVCEAINHSVGSGTMTLDGFRLNPQEVMTENYMDFAFPTELITEAMKEISAKDKDFPDILAANPFYDV